MKYKTIITLLIVVFFYSRESFSGNLYFFNADIGRYLYHEDNSISLTRDNDFIFTAGANIGMYYNFDNYKLLLTLGFNSSEAKNVYSKEYYNGKQNVDLFQKSIPISINLVFFEGNFFDLSAGIAFNNNIRTVKILNQDKSVFNDTLYSLGLGSNFLVFKNYAINKKETLFLRPTISIKSNIGIYYDKSGRNLDDYNQIYSTINFSLGMLFSI